MLWLAAVQRFQAMALLQDAERVWRIVAAELMIIQHQLTNSHTNVQISVHVQHMEGSFNFLTGPEGCHFAM